MLISGMKQQKADIWTLLPGHHIVIPTNVGWKANGANVMGAGLAKDAARRYPELAAWYGAFCKEHAALTSVTSYPAGPLILFPVKKLRMEQPWMSWASEASLDLIERSARQLSELPGEDPIAVPMVGCGNGGRKPEEVIPILNRYLMGDRYLLVIW